MALGLWKMNVCPIYFTQKKRCSITLIYVLSLVQQNWWKTRKTWDWQQCLCSTKLSFQSPLAARAVFKTSRRGCAKFLYVHSKHARIREPELTSMPFLIFLYVSLTLLRLDQAQPEFHESGRKPMNRFQNKKHNILVCKCQKANSITRYGASWQVNINAFRCRVRSYLFR